MAKRALPNQEIEIDVSVVDQDANKTFFRLAMDTRMSKVIESYNLKYKHEDGVLTFLYEGNRIFGKDTPAKLGMVDGDEISVMEQGMGGAFTIVNPN